MKIIVDKEFSKLIPKLSDEEYKQLEENIIKDGCRDPLSIWKDILLDGHNRYEICQKNKIKFDTVDIELESRDDVKIWIIQNQLGKRNLTHFQRIELVTYLEPLYAKKAKERQAEAGKKKLPLNLAEAVEVRVEMAKLSGVSHGTYAKGKEIVEKASDKEKEDLRKGNTTINKVYSGIQKEKRMKEEKKSRSEIVSDIDIRKGDFKKVLNDVNDIDAIITDPPYPKEYLDCFSDLSKFASEHLKNGGFVAVYSGQYNLPEVIKRLSEHLTYVWTFCLYHVGKKQLVNGVNIMCGWKPVLIFSKGNKKMRFSAYDVLVSEQSEKSSHKWQQSESGVKSLIEIFSRPGDLVVDPFAGSGTFLKVAKDMGRLGIGAEIE